MPHNPSRKRLPPNGKRFLPVPDSGVRVAIGPGAWDFVRGHLKPCMVAMDDSSAYRWPVDDRPSLVFERGPINDETLHPLCLALLTAGTPFIVVIREALLETSDPCIYVYPEVRYAAA
jgi:hypothetical protein